MASSIVEVTAVTGTGPTYTLTTDSNQSASIGDYITLRRDGIIPPADNQEGVYRISDLPTATSMTIVDDVSYGSLYGLPAPGRSSVFTPTTNLKLSQPPTSGPNFAEMWRRDKRALDDKVGSLELIGDPTPPDTWGDAGLFFTWNNTVPIPDALYDLNEGFAQLAPEKAGVLTGQSLVLSGTTQYNAKLPSGLSSAWGSYTPGDTITNLVVDGTYTLATPSQSTVFRAGLSADPSTAGVIKHVLNDVDGDTRDIGVDGVGTTGVLQVTDLSTYNTFWLKGNAQLNITQSEGVAKHEIDHTEAGTSDPTTLYHDDVNTTPSFSVLPAAAAQVEVTKFLSGVEYYTTGTVIRVTYTAAPGIFEKAYHPTQVSRIEIVGASNKTVNPASVPAFNSTLVVSGTAGDVTLSVGNQATSNPLATVRLYKPNGLSTSQTAGLARPINTYGVISNTTTDQFYDEDKRLELGTATVWTPAATLTNGNLQVRNGDLRHGNVGDYAGFTGDQAYERRITKVSASGGTLAHTGVTIAQLGTGNANILLHLEDEDVWFDIGLDVGLNNGDGSGNSIANSKGARVSGGAGSTTFSFGLFSTGNNTNRYRVRIVYRNTTPIMTFLQGT